MNKLYAYINQDGYVIFTGQSIEPSEHPGLTAVELEHLIPQGPSTSHRYHLSTNTWHDTSTDDDRKLYLTRNVLQTRNTLLLNSDWTQLPNNPLSKEKQQAWSEYRQNLRDITTQAGYPEVITWPVKPT